MLFNHYWNKYHKSYDNNLQLINYLRINSIFIDYSIQYSLL